MTVLVAAPLQAGARTETGAQVTRFRAESAEFIKMVIGDLSIKLGDI